MSVLIRNIKMPEDCYECLMCHQRFDGYREETRLACSALEDWAEEEEGRLDNCPLIEVPTPHGRLIDADALESKIRKQYCEDCDRRKGIKNGKMQFCYEIGDAPCRACSIDDMCAELDDAPTIIEAED